jgi:hypothetical protein
MFATILSINLDEEYARCRTDYGTIIGGDVP